MRPGEVVGLFDSAPVAGNRSLEVIVHKTIEQMVYEEHEMPPAAAGHVNLTPADVPDMMQLVELTKPGPFAARTIALGSYIGIRAGGQLVAMAGERMRFPGLHRNLGRVHASRLSSSRLFVSPRPRAHTQHPRPRRNSLPPYLQR